MSRQHRGKYNNISDEERLRSSDYFKRLDVLFPLTPWKLESIPVFPITLQRPHSKILIKVNTQEDLDLCLSQGGLEIAPNSFQGWSDKRIEKYNSKIFNKK